MKNAGINYFILALLSIVFASADSDSGANMSLVPESVSAIVSDEVFSPDEIARPPSLGRLNEPLEKVMSRALSNSASDSYLLYEYYAFQLNDRTSAMIWLTVAADGGMRNAQFCLARYFWNKAKIGPDRISLLRTARFWAQKSGSMDPKLLPRIDRAIRDETVNPDSHRQ